MPKINNYLGRNFKKERKNDKLSKRKRSELMSKIHAKNTKFEKEFIIYLKKYTRKKFQTNVALIKGKPDIVFLKDKACVFLDSDFWHGWQYPRWKHLLKNNFWRGKIESNRIRDKRITLYLRKNNWKVFRVWEHSVRKNPKQAIARIAKF